MSPVGTAEPRRVKIVSQPHANPRRHANPHAGKFHVEVSRYLSNGLEMSRPASA
jgi:hypothetical protein